MAIHHVKIAAITVLTFGALSWLAVPMHAFAAQTRNPDVKSFEVAKKGSKIHQQNQFLGFDVADLNGGTVAVCDLNNDGTDEIVVGAGHGSGPQVKVFDKDGHVLSSFMALPESMHIGLNIACGKLDGKKEPARIVVGAGRGGSPQVQVFDMQGNKKTSFFAFDEKFHGGVFVAVGKVDKKAKGQQIIVGAGPGGGAQVRVFNKNGNYMGQDFFPFDSSFRGGVSVAVANVDGGRQAEIIMGQYIFGGQVKVYKNNSDKAIVSEFFPYGNTFQGGINVANVKDVDKNGGQDFATIPRQGGAPHLQVFQGSGHLINNSTFAYEQEYRGGVSIAGGNIDDDAKSEIVAIPQKQYAEGRTDLGTKYIEVNLSTQHLTAYEFGVKQFDFPISSGVARYPSPQGITKITAKIASHDYEWSYGENHPDNYDIKDVPWNLRYRDHYYYHAAYWHNNFGHQMSHGCINISIPNAEKLYKWADVGTTSWIHP